MPINEALLPEFDNEMANTRKTLERVPDGKFSWKPHDKSGTMGWLAGHLAEIPRWATETLKNDELDMSPGGVRMQQPPSPKTQKELLERFDQNVKAARASIAAASDADFIKMWSLLDNGKKLFTMPKIACIRGWVMNHTIHHRAQLGVYLRLNNLPVPAIYGPSADENPMM
jgi:uncharacterized damage-inducible protein DinB